MTTLCHYIIQSTYMLKVDKYIFFYVGRLNNDSKIRKIRKKVGNEGANSRIVGFYMILF